MPQWLEALGERPAPIAVLARPGEQKQLHLEINGASAEGQRFACLGKDAVFQAPCRKFWQCGGW